MTDQTKVPAMGQSNEGALAGTLKRSGDAHRLGILDDCRGIAAIMVFLGHCEDFLPADVGRTLVDPLGFIATVFAGKADLHSLASFIAFFPFHLDWCALSIFFVVSGFCIHMTYFQPSRPSVAKFYLRRLFRIYPAYLLAIIAFGVFFPGSRLPFTKLTHWAQFITHLLLCYNISDYSVWAIAASYWTIAVEVQLYLLFPLLALFVRRYSYNWALLWLLLLEVTLHTISVLFCYNHGQVPPAWFRCSPFFYCFSWAIGAGLADAYLNRKPLPLARVHPAVWLIPFLFTSSWQSHEYSFTFFALFFTSFLARHFQRAERNPNAEAETKSWVGRFVRQTGLRSYSFYLLHEPILIAVVLLYEAHFPGIEKNSYLIFLAAASSWIITYPLSGLMYRWVELPGIALGKKLIRTMTRRSDEHLQIADLRASS
jgi:peptidoglycan/LPS O-acetylase OafA/YrhL